MIKMKIGKKLLLTYFILLIGVFVITGITFKILLQQYLISEARIALKEEAQTIAKTLEKVPISNDQIKPNLLVKQEIRILGQFIDSKVILLNGDKKIIYSNFADIDRKVLQPLINSNKFKFREYLAERAPILSKNGEAKGYILLFTKIHDLDQISRLLNRTQVMSLIVGGVFAVILGMILQIGITKPIRKLQHYMNNFSFKDNQGELRIHTGDEIEELADCFSNMVDKLKRYDVQQKSFIQNASHELKTPLMSIQGYAEAIKDGVVEGREIEESLYVIINESQRLKKIVDEMIYLTKLDNVEESFHFEKSDIYEIVNQSVKSVKTLVDAKGINLIVEGDCSFEGYFDNEKLYRAFINILSNGIRYAGNEIRINCKSNDCYIEITIIDDGKGFQNGEEKKVFERFYKGAEGGTGIGLAITKAIVTGHNGQIEAYNAMPNGAAFKITLPKLQKNTA